MICKRGGFIIQRHNELRDLEAELLKMVCYDVKVENKSKNLIDSSTTDLMHA